MFKELCFFYNIQYSDNETFTALYKKVQDKLKLNPTLYNKNEKHKKALSFTSKIHKLFVHINELRNIYSDSHGIIGKESINFSSLPKHHYKLIVDSTKTITNFLIESNFYQRQK